MSDIPEHWPKPPNRPRRERHCPGPAIGGSGGEVSLTIRGAHIYCGHHNWLYEHYGNVPANWQISYHR